MWCIKNKGDESIKILGMIIAPGSVSRPLSELELREIWCGNIDIGEKAVIVPCLLESEQNTSEPANEAVRESKTALAAEKSRGRAKYRGEQ